MSKPTSKTPLERATHQGWWEEYRCGCVSKTVRLKRDLVGYCGKHGNSARQVHPEIKWPNEKTEATS